MTPVTRSLVLAATACSGVVAGTTIDTAVVKLPTWRRLGAESWAAYTNDELRTSLVWYPMLGTGAVLVTIASAVAVHRDGEAARTDVLASRTVGVLALAHLLTSGKAAPAMTRVRETSDPGLLQEALSTFRRWHLARTGVDVLTFALNLRNLTSSSGQQASS